MADLPAQQWTGVPDSQCPHTGCGWTGYQVRNHHNSLSSKRSRSRRHEHDESCVLCREWAQREVRS